MFFAFGAGSLAALRFLPSALHQWAFSDPPPTCSVSLLDKHLFPSAVHPDQQGFFLCNPLLPSPPRKEDKKEMLLCQREPADLVSSSAPKAGAEDEAASLRTRSPGLPTAAMQLRVSVGSDTCPVSPATDISSHLSSALRCPLAHAARFQHWALKTAQAGGQLESHSLGENPPAAAGDLGTENTGFPLMLISPTQAGPLPDARAVVSELMNSQTLPSPPPSPPQKETQHLTEKRNLSVTVDPPSWIQPSAPESTVLMRKKGNQSGDQHSGKDCL
ncbi:hypothetical protein MJG53_006823 [Ovis ammon polii x Ovis aries]|uniref:Uncharacterized protein n=1 Tax=Ovis ammon polii x Ovis aries TaxID=2918886 RepID=A0ACB9V5T4_9CETA|nr:hypothetical protein MJG53_006823 [Ovis ammon polii x Ovis aries]